MTGGVTTAGVDDAAAAARICANCSAKLRGAVETAAGGVTTGGTLTTGATTAGAVRAAAAFARICANCSAKVSATGAVSGGVTAGGVTTGGVPVAGSVGVLPPEPVPIGAKVSLPTIQKPPLSSR